MLRLWSGLVDGTRDALSVQTDGQREASNSSADDADFVGHLVVLVESVPRL